MLTNSAATGQSDIFKGTATRDFSAPVEMSRFSAE
jgi:hypothetical protein